MKNAMFTLAILALMASTGMATEPNNASTTNQQEQSTSILSPTLEALFMNDRLNEAIVKPTYSAAEQLIFSEQVRQLKQEVKRKNKQGK